MADNPFRPKYLILHDYGGRPNNADGMHNPYHTLVFPDGAVRHRNPANPYGAPAPHAFRMNPMSIGLSYADTVGAKPTEPALASIKREYERIKSLFPDIKAMSHGEAFAQTRGTPYQASRDGRGLEEASWRTSLVQGASGPTVQEPSQPPPLAARTLTAFAGVPSGAAGGLDMQAATPSAAKPLAPQGAAAPVQSLRRRQPAPTGDQFVPGQFWSNITQNGI